MRTNKLIIIGILGILFFLGFADSSVTKASNPGDMSINYNPRQVISGWVNISLDNEPYDSLLTFLNSNITLKEFLDLNNANYSCEPNNCSSYYSPISDGSSTITFDLGYDKKTVGLKLTGEIENINNLRFDLVTNAEESCLNPLTIDVLDDSNIEWKANAMSQQSCTIGEYRGCYIDSSSNQLTEINKESYYCEKINLSYSRGYMIGANVNGSGNTVFKLIISTDNSEKECNVSVTKGGEIGCMIELENEMSDKIQANVCLYKLEPETNNYSIKYEDHESCGYVLNSYGQYAHDFDIFAKPLKYSKVNGFSFGDDFINNQNISIDLNDEINSYIQEKYSGNCTEECIIPISFNGITQQITLSNINLNYQDNGITHSENKIYDIVKSKAKISTNFKKLILDKAKFLAPSNPGKYSGKLKLGSYNIFNKDINVSIEANNSIIDILPHDPALYVPIIFIVVNEKEEKNATYYWDFGDGSEEKVTSSYSAEHTYLKNGSFDLTVRIVNQNRQYSKTVRVMTSSPRDHINKTISSYRIDLNNYDNQVNSAPENIQTEVKKIISTQDLRTTLNSEEKNYKEALNSEDEKFIAIMSRLVNMEIPYKFETKAAFPISEFYQAPEELKGQDLRFLDAGEYEDNMEKYIPQINNWLYKSFDIKVEAKEYNVYYRNKESPENLFSDVKIAITPKTVTEEKMFFIINSNPAKIIFNNEYDDKNINDKATGIVINGLNEQNTIEFLYPGKVRLMELPFYFAPELNNLGIINENIKNCNYNSKCESQDGENYKDCPNDCKNWGMIIIVLLIWLFIALCIYIALQEWYKRYYERHLFKDRNQLFNLINFMNISLNQGVKKNEIFTKLKNKGWTNEQLTYAWKKLHGKRTGMLEIPIFIGKEKKEVKRELERRGNNIRF